MKVKCIKLTFLTIRQIPQLGRYEHLNDYQDMLTLGKSYSVYGFALFNNTLLYLLDISEIFENTRIMPHWYPAEIFDVLDSSLPKETFFKYFGENDKRGVQALWGYYELVHDYYHYIGLVELEFPSVLQIFHQRVQEIDSNP